jgi:hypothetical protein
MNMTDLAEGLTIKQLKLIADRYHVAYKSKVTRSELIDRLGQVPEQRYTRWGDKLTDRQYKAYVKFTERFARAFGKAY